MGSGANLPFDLYQSDTTIHDPGPGGTVVVDRQFASLVLDDPVYGAERTLADPEAVGLWFFVSVLEGGTLRLVTSTGTYLLTPESYVSALVSIPYGAGYRWLPIGNLRQSRYLEGPQGPQGPQGYGLLGPQGDEGPAGELGSGVHYNDELASLDDLPEDAEVGDSYLIGGNLYIWNGSGFDDGGTIQGPSSPASIVTQLIQFEIRGVAATSMWENGLEGSTPLMPMDGLTGYEVAAAQCYLATPSTLPTTFAIIEGQDTPPFGWLSGILKGYTYTILAGQRTVSMATLVGTDVAPNVHWGLFVTDGFDGMNLSVSLEMVSS